MSVNTLGKMEIMRGERAVAALFASGRSGFRHPFKYIWRISEAENEAGGSTCVNRDKMAAQRAVIKILFSVPKRNFKKAVRRNLLRRRMREAYRLNKTPLCDRMAAAGIRVELALIYSSKEMHDFKTIEHGIRKVLAEVGERL